ncbi:MAG TPA: alpha-N-arabinofuranosidase [Vicinamibacterales bacterium]|nr:alpha-N-arabinofuranosidase [Vicinamibacterales bacterium]
MTECNRRAFLARAGAAAAFAAAGSWLQAIGYAQAGARGPARVFLRRSPARGDFDRRLFGSFLEHLGRAIYTGVYQPGSRLADAKGFRIDVARDIKELGVPIVRYPGGNFVSGYNWLDGVGPKAQRPVVLDRAWNSLETNQFGTNEFVDWCAMVGAEPLLGMNFGTGSVEMAVAYVEYCNGGRGTRWSELRRSHGHDRPHNVRYWCLGNEMDGPWQIGQLQAREYGRKARDAAKQMRVIDPNLQLIACGSSGTFMPTYMVWDREVLEECYDQVDGISLHAYYGNTREWSGNSTARYLAMNLDMDRHIHEVAAVCDYVQALQRSSKKLWLSFDEWNVWYRARDAKATDGKGAPAPPLLEEVYNLEDALLVGGFVNTLLRNSDRVRVACLAQLVNVIAPLVTSETGILRQSTYYPYSWALRYAKGRVLDVRVESDTYPIRADGLQADFARNGDVPFVDVVATVDDGARQAAALMLNRDLDGEREVVLEFEGVTPTRVLACETLTGPDLKAVNTFAEPRRVAPLRLEAPAAADRMTFKLPPRSYTVVHLATT